MEKHLMKKFKKILENEKDIKNVKMYVNLEMSWVVSYEYNGEIYVLNTDIIERGENENE